MKIKMIALLAGISRAPRWSPPGGASAQTRGVTDTEVVVGSHTALTGPVAPWGVGAT